MASWANNDEVAILILVGLAFLGFGLHKIGWGREAWHFLDGSEGFFAPRGGFFLTRVEIGISLVEFDKR